MECIFLNAAGVTLFTRSDMESGHWVQQEMNMTADFPFNPDKEIKRGQRIAFRDPATQNIEVFEVRIVRNQEPDHYQQITAEHIALAELSDEFFNSQEITSKTASEAITTALTGTLWSVGNNTASGSQSADFSRGTVWDAVNTIQQNWNVYITPRITFSTSGSITGRYLDIAPAEGTWRGLRLSVRKNLLDPVVTYDDSEVYTALYGYGGNVGKTHSGGDDTSEELTFANEVWTATSSHPAKPSGQTYLEWPEKTAIYGRNGRARFGHYQNGNIKDAGVLLQKTWESLQKSCEPKISIDGTCTDLYRLGYKGQPIRLHDLAIVDIEETGEVFQKQIICCDVDLIDPTGTRVEIGDYIPNIIYINRETDKRSGGGGGGRGAGSMTNLEDDEIKTFADFVKTENMVGMVVGTRQGNNYVKAGEIVLSINETGNPGSPYESAAAIKADHVNISATSTAHMLAGSIVYDANGNLVLKESTGGGVLVEHNDHGTTSTFGVWDKGNLTGGVMVQQINGQPGETAVKILGSVINIGDLITVINNQSGSHVRIDADEVVISGSTSVEDLLTGEALVSLLNATEINSSDFSADYGEIETLETTNLTVDGTGDARWQTHSVITGITYSNASLVNFLYGSVADGATGVYAGHLVSSYSSATIHYLGLAPT